MRRAMSASKRKADKHLPMAKKRKAPGRPGKRRAAPARTRRRAQPLPREIPLGQGLQAFASEGIRSLFWVIVAASAVAIVAAVAAGIWTLRPIPEYSSDGVEIGSPFDVTFQIRNTSQWFALSRPGIGCILTYPGAPDLPPVKSSGNPPRLEPGQSGTFRCPFPAALREATNGETATALRSRIYFRTTYDLPFFESFRLTDNRGPFVLNTQLLPPRWTASQR
jgi:hypothetical protein